MVTLNLSFTGGLAPAGVTAAVSGQLDGKEIFCCSVWILTVVVLGEGSSGSGLSCRSVCFGRKQTRLSRPRGCKGEASFPAGGQPYLQLGALWKLYQGLVWGRARVCRESLRWGVRVGWRWGLGPGLCTAGAVQKGLDRCEVQVDSVGLGLARSICPRGRFLGSFHLQRRDRGFQHRLCSLGCGGGARRASCPCLVLEFTGHASWGSFH